jgi:hypothetical protein
MSNIYLKSLRGKNRGLTIDCCVAMLYIDRLHREGHLSELEQRGFTWVDVPCHQTRLTTLLHRGIIDRVDGTNHPYEYLVPVETMEWYHKHIDGSDLG